MQLAVAAEEQAAVRVVGARSCGLPPRCWPVGTVVGEAPLAGPFAELRILLAPGLHPPGDMLALLGVVLAALSGEVLDRPASVGRRVVVDRPDIDVEGGRYPLGANAADPQPFQLGDFAVRELVRAAPSESLGYFMRPPSPLSALASSRTCRGRARPWRSATRRGQSWPTASRCRLA